MTRGHVIRKQRRERRIDIIMDVLNGLQAIGLVLGLALLMLLPDLIMP